MKTACITFGAVFILIGILGFIPQVAPDEHLLGIFHVNTAHNIVHLLTGGVAIIAGLTATNASKIFFGVFGVVYGLIALIGFFAGDRPILGISNNVADAILHAFIAAVSLTIGFSKRVDWQAEDPHPEAEEADATGTRSYT